MFWSLDYLALRCLLQLVLLRPVPRASTSWRSWCCRTYAGRIGRPPVGGEIRELVLRPARDPEGRQAVTAQEPIGRMGTPEEIAAAVVWLCSDAASFVLGHALVIDGGQTT